MQRTTASAARDDQPATAIAAARPRTLTAIGLMCLAVICFSCLDTSGKYLVTVAGLPTAEVVWVRFFGQFVAIVLVLGLVALPRLLATSKFKFQIFRSFLLLGSTAFNFLALRELRLDQTTTIMFMAPLMVALLAGPLLGEWVGWRRMTAIVVGFSGILIVVRPGVATFQPAMIFAFCGMMSYAAFILVTRYLSRFDPSEVTLFFSLLAGSFLVAPLAYMSWVWPREILHYFILAGMGMWGALGHYLFIVAHKHAPASTIAPFIYTQLLTMTGLGYLIFDDLPDAWSLVGAGVVVASGIYLLYREAKVKQAR